MAEERTRLGRYELRGEIGRGAMGVVYRARDPLIGRALAVKCIELRGDATRRAHLRASFLQEAHSAGRLNHPNIVTIYDAGETDDCAWIAMELLEGPSLRELLDARAPFALTRALDIAAQIARGLACAHAHGVVHQDIKPANIVLVRRRVKITDFGIAGLFGRGEGVAHNDRPVRGARVTAGSPRYMAPEQVCGARIDARADLYALGAVLHEMLVGRPPFEAETVAALQRAVLGHEVPVLRVRDARMPAGVEALVHRALAKAPIDRPASALRMARELHVLARRHRPTVRGHFARLFGRRRIAPQAVDGATVLLSDRAGASPRNAPRSWWLFGAFLVVGVLTAGGGWPL